jgi:ectoine hydroxylase-related dioxygenase (phytanoyl-CoA dioxygenase family)
VRIGDWETTSDLAEIFRDAQKHDLVENLAELEAFGFTVVPPDKVGPPERRERITAALLDVHERRTGQRITDITDGTTGVEGPISGHFALLNEDRVFEELLLNPAVYTLARYTCGRSVVLSDMLALLKNQDPTPTHLLHTDQHGTPPPLPPYPQVSNVTLALTDYTLDSGPVAIVPGSHRFGRKPNPYETNHLAENPTVKAIPVEAAAGSLIVWSGTTWHGSYPRKAPGIRANVIMVFSRPYMRPITDFRSMVTPEMLERNPPEFADLLGTRNPYPFGGGDFPPKEDVARFVASGSNPWG